MNIVDKLRMINCTHGDAVKAADIIEGLMKALNFYAEACGATDKESAINLWDNDCYGQTARNALENLK